MITASCFINKYGFSDSIFGHVMSGFSNSDSDDIFFSRIWPCYMLTNKFASLKFRINNEFASNK